MIAPDENAPSGTVANGRDAKGRFGVGNKLGKGNPLARRTAALRFELIRSVEPGDLRAVFRSMVDAAKAGDVSAAKLVFERVLGAPVEVDVLARLEELERDLAEARRW